MDPEILISVLLFRSLLKIEYSFDSNCGRGNFKEALNGRPKCSRHMHNMLHIYKGSLLSVYQRKSTTTKYSIPNVNNLFTVLAEETKEEN